MQLVLQARVPRPVRRRDSSFKPVTTMEEKVTEDAMRMQPSGLPVFGFVESLEPVEYQVYEEEEDVLLVYGAFTYAQELEVVNSFVTTEVALTSVPVVVFVKTRAKLLAVTIAMITVGAAALFGLGSPYNFIGLIAVIGPLSVAAYGFKTQS